MRRRFQLLLKALAKRFDGRIAGLVLTETAVSIDKDHPPAGFTCSGNFTPLDSNSRLACSMESTRTARCRQPCSLLSLVSRTPKSPS